MTKQNETHEGDTQDGANSDELVTPEEHAETTNSLEPTQDYSPPEKVAEHEDQTAE